MEVVSIGAVAAQNIAQAAELDMKHVPVIEQAIKDEIQAMSSHFTLAFADIQAQYETALAEARSARSFVMSNKILVGVVLFITLVIGHVL